MVSMIRTASIPVPAGPRHGGELPGTVLAALLAVALAALPFLLRHRAYYYDDMQSQYVPLLVAMGKSLSVGFWPSLTLQVSLGGALAGEYQYALYNPVELLKMLTAAQFHDLEAAAAFLAIADYAVLGGATYLIARRFGANHAFALLASTAFTCNNFIFYWYASSWRPGLSSMGYLLFACAFLMKAHKSRAAFAATVAASYLTMTAGWPQAILALGLFLLFPLHADWSAGRRRDAAARVLALACAGLLALPAVLPLLAMGSHAAREGGTFNDGMFQPNLYSLLALSSPFQFPQFSGFAGYVTSSVPQYFAAWYVVPLLAYVDFDKARRMPSIKALLIGAAIALIITQGPQQLSVLRFPFRFIPYFHLIVLVTFSVLATRARAPVTEGRTSVAIALICFQAIVALQMQPKYQWLIMLAVLVMIAGCHVATRMIRRGGSAEPLVLSAVTIAFFVLTHVLFPISRDLPDWAAPRTTGEVTALSAIPDRYTAVIGQPQPNIAIPAAHPFGNMRLVQGEASIYGYSPIGEINLATKFHNMTHGPANADSFEAHLQPTAYDGLRFIDLTKTDKVVLLELPAAAAAQMAAEGFSCRAEGYVGQVCQRTLPPGLPGSLAFASPGVAIDGVPGAIATRERFKASTGAEGNGIVVFNRIAWPGYRLTLNGADIPLSRDGFGLLTARLPAGISGEELTLTYRPPGFLIGVATALAGAILMVGLLLGGQLWPRRAAR